MLANLLMLTPLLLTLVLALVLRRTLVALGVGIVSGALILSSFNPLESIHYLSSTAWQQFYANGQRPMASVAFKCAGGDGAVRGNDAIAGPRRRS